MFNVQKRKYVSMQGAPNIESLNIPLQVIKLFDYLALAEFSFTYFSTSALKYPQFDTLKNNIFNPLVK